jgi:AcrR family transcriptional regulator
MLREMPVSAMSLNELSRRVGLAKSNVLRYFESREAVLLDLLVHASGELLTGVADELPAEVDRSAPVNRRVPAVAAGLATSFAARGTLCELLSRKA